MNMSLEETKKALHCLAECRECTGSSCEYYMETNDVQMCDNVSIAKDTLEHIKWLEAVNTELQKKTDLETASRKFTESTEASLKSELELAKAFHQEAIAERDLKAVQIMKMEAEISDLKIELQGMRNAANGYKKECNGLSNLIQKARTEAVKKFAKKLKEEYPVEPMGYSGIGSLHSADGIHRKINKLLEEGDM